MTALTSSGDSGGPAEPNVGQSERRECPVSTSDGVPCALPAHHNSPHAAASGTLTWEPIYVAEMRREVERGPWRWRGLLSEVLADLGPDLRSEAIDDAREALRKDES